MAPSSNGRLALFGTLALCAVPLLFSWLDATTSAPDSPRGIRARVQSETQKSETLSDPQRQDARLQPGAPAPALSSPVEAHPPMSNHDEHSIVAELKELQLSDPERSLHLARDSMRRFPHGPTAPERSWYEARALVELGRLGQARQVAAWMLEQYPESPFTADARRHLLSHPF